MATSNITDTITDPSGTPVGAGHLVEAVLMPTAGFRISDSTGIARREATTTDAAGSFTLTLERNANIDPPSNSFWMVTIHLPESLGGAQVWPISVGNSNATLKASLVIPSSDAGLALYLTQAVADARYSTIGGSLPFVNAKVDYGAGNSSDDTVKLQAAATAAAGGILICPTATYTIDPTTPILIPNNTVVISYGATFLMKPNIATANAIYRLFAGSSATPHDISFYGGLFDGNRRNGNHGAGENVAGIWMSDGLRIKVKDAYFYNFRSEGFYAGHSAAIPDKYDIENCFFEDCGFPEGGDTNTNPRQGCAFIAGRRIRVKSCWFKTINAYGVDFEANTVSVDLFSEISVDDCTFEACGIGWINVAPQAAVDAVNVDVVNNRGTGTTTGSTIVVKAVGGSVTANVGMVSSSVNAPILLGFGASRIAVGLNSAETTSNNANAAPVVLDNCTRCIVIGNNLKGTLCGQGVREGGGASANNILGPNNIDNAVHYTTVAATTFTSDDPFLNLVLTFTGASGNVRHLTQALNLIGTQIITTLASGTEAFRANSSAHLVPGADNGRDLGVTATRWRNMFQIGYQELSEIADPGAGPANTGRFYCRDNGAGKSQFVAVFPSGAVQVIATEP